MGCSDRCLIITIAGSQFSPCPGQSIQGEVEVGLDIDPVDDYDGHRFNFKGQVK